MHQTRSLHTVIGSLTERLVADSEEVPLPSCPGALDPAPAAEAGAGEGGGGGAGLGAAIGFREDQDSTFLQKSVFENFGFQNAFQFVLKILDLANI